MSFLLSWCVFCGSETFFLSNKLNREVKPHYRVHLQLIMEPWGSQKQMPGFLQDLCGWRVEVLKLEAGSAFPLVLPFKNWKSIMERGQSSQKIHEDDKQGGKSRRKLFQLHQGVDTFCNSDFLIGCCLCVSTILECPTWTLSEVFWCLPQTFGRA